MHARRPLMVDSVADGYVHMKFAVLRDTHGDRLYISGSLNESRTALHLNAENIDVHCSWRGEDPAARVADAEQRFSLMWGDENAAMRVMRLPEAVQQRLIEFAKPPPLRSPDEPVRAGLRSCRSPSRRFSSQMTGSQQKKAQDLHFAPEI
jgi:hypothetical protein